MTTAAEISTLERLDKLESRVQIDELPSGYAFGCDQHDAERWLSVFSDDANWLIGGELGNPIGRAAISAAFSDNEYVRRDGDWKMSKVHIEIYWQKEVQLIEP